MVTDGDISALRKEIAELRGLLRTNMRSAQRGQPWQPLTVPPGASGSAWWRPALGGHAEVRVSLTWLTVPSAAVLAGIAAGSWPRVPYQGVHGGVQVQVSTAGTITLTALSSPLNLAFPFPLY
jgi:hypothetical protein